MEVYEDYYPLSGRNFTIISSHDSTVCGAGLKSQDFRGPSVCGQWPDKSHENYSKGVVAVPVRSIANIYIVYIAQRALHTNSWPGNHIIKPAVNIVYFLQIAS